MKAVVYKGVKQVAVEDIEMAPDPRKDRCALKDHVGGYLRLGPAYVRRAHAV